MKINEAVLLFAGLFVSALLVSCEKKAEESVNAPVPVREGLAVEEELEVVEEPEAPIIDPHANLVPPEPAKVIPASKLVEAKVVSEPYALKDLSTIKVTPGSDSPKVGEMIYSYTNIPKEECGEFWVLEDNGYVVKLAKCSGDHADGHSH